jgi:hypothetical protein
VTRDAHRPCNAPCPAQGGRIVPSHKAGIHMCNMYCILSDIAPRCNEACLPLVPRCLLAPPPPRRWSSAPMLEPCREPPSLSDAADTPSRRHQNLAITCHGASAIRCDGRPTAHCWLAVQHGRLRCTYWPVCMRAARSLLVHTATTCMYTSGRSELCHPLRTPHIAPRTAPASTVDAPCRVVGSGGGGGGGSGWAAVHLGVL